MLHTFCEPLEFLKTQLLIPEGLTCVNKAWEMRCDFFFFFLEDMWHGSKRQKPRWADWLCTWEELCWGGA